MVIKAKSGPTSPGDGQGGKASAGHTPELIADAVLRHRLQKDAAEDLGVNPATLSRWLRRDDVRAALRQTGQAALALHAERSKVAAEKALRTLEDLLSEDNEPSVRRAAAHDLLAHVSRAAVLGSSVDDRQASTLSPLQRLQAALCGPAAKAGADEG